MADTPTLDEITPNPDAPPPPDAAGPKPRRGSARKPRSGTSTRKPRTSSRNTGPSAATVAETVAGLHRLTGDLLLPMAGKPATGALLAAQADAAGQLWAELAKRYPALQRIFTAGETGTLLVQATMIYWPVVSLALSEQRQQPRIDPAFLAATEAFAQQAQPERGDGYGTYAMDFDGIHDGPPIDLTPAAAREAADRAQEKARQAEAELSGAEGA